jgi:uncharacterized membrane protein
MHAPERHATQVAALAVALLTALGVGLRAAVASDSMLADELSTYWIISATGLGDVISTVHSNAEITPPLHFIAAWLATRIDLTPELARAPSVLAGAATIPAVYLLGLRTVGRAAALVAAAIASLAPFMIYYSAEARSYALTMLLVTLSTLAMLNAVDARRTRWWVPYAFCSCAAMYTHYTSVFALGAQLVWLLWAHPEARRAALLANIAAVVAFLPWLSGLRADLNSPTTEILSALSPFDWTHVRAALTHAAVGYPYSSLSLRALPGLPALILLALGVAMGLAGLARAALAAGPRAWLARADRRILLVFALALSVPVAEMLVSAVGTNLFSARNLAASWPAFALCLGALLIAAGPRLRLVAAPLAVAGLAIGAAKMLDETYSRPKYDKVAQFIESKAEAEDVVVDGAVLSPGPYTPLEVALRGPHRVFRFQAPVQRDRPFGVFDRSIPEAEVVPRALAAAGKGSVFVVSVRGHQVPDTSRFPARYRVAESRTYPGTDDLRVQVWSDR